MKLDVLHALNDLSYICECAAQDHTGELKTELRLLCSSIANRKPAYCAPEIIAMHATLEDALAMFVRRDNSLGTIQICRVLRYWWTIALQIASND